MRTCNSCGCSFEPTGNVYKCLPCRRVADKKWREARKEQGNPVKSPQMCREYHRSYERGYYQRPEVKEKRAASERIRRCDKSHSEKIMARGLVRKALRSGELKKLPCEVCGEVKVDGHHDDYSKPLQVRWLCRIHHCEYHAKAEG